MGDVKNKYRVFFSAAEPSADSHCAALIENIKKSGLDVECVGVGGDKMAKAGCELLEKTTERAAMTYNAFGQIFYFKKVINRVKNYFTLNKVDLAVVCDSPAFNFHIAKTGKEAGCKTLFYVAPQLWAWAPWRIKKLKRWCDKLCCILPFEELWFRERGVHADFIGNPLMEGVEVGAKKYYLGFNPAWTRLALMPGSRDSEVKTLWEPMQYIAVQLQEVFPKLTVTAVAVDEKRKEFLQANEIDGFECVYNVGNVYDTAKESDYTVVASGSATLQAAAAGCPMSILYQSSKLLWLLVGKWLVTTPYLSLVNILAQHELVPEYMPYFDAVEPIVEKIALQLNNKESLIDTSDALIELVGPLAEDHPSQRLVEIIGEMLD